MLCNLRRSWVVVEKILNVIIFQTTRRWNNTSPFNSKHLLIYLQVTYCCLSELIFPWKYLSYNMWACVILSGISAIQALLSQHFVYFSFLSLYSKIDLPSTTMKGIHLWEITDNKLSISCRIAFLNVHLIVEFGHLPYMKFTQIISQGISFSCIVVILLMGVDFVLLFSSVYGLLAFFHGCGQHICIYGYNQWCFKKSNSHSCFYNHSLVSGDRCNKVLLLNYFFYSAFPFLSVRMILSK